MCLPCVLVAHISLNQSGVSSGCPREFVRARLNAQQYVVGEPILLVGRENSGRCGAGIDTLTLGILADSKILFIEDKVRFPTQKYVQMQRGLWGEVVEGAISYNWRRFLDLNKTVQCGCVRACGASSLEGAVQIYTGDDVARCIEEKQGLDAYRVVLDRLMLMR